MRKTRATVVRGSAGGMPEQLRTHPQHPAVSRSEQRQGREDVCPPYQQRLPQLSVGGVLNLQRIIMDHTAIQMFNNNTLRTKRFAGGCKRHSL